MAVDTPVVGWRGEHVNTLRLWTARAFDPIKLDRFNAGDFSGALADQLRAETLTRVLYPNDSTAAGQELRLRQEYFFSSASIQDIVRRHIEDAIDRGATAVVGGPDAVGDRFIQPTVLTGVPEDAAAITEETFGPTVTVTVDT